MGGKKSRLRALNSITNSELNLPYLVTYQSFPRTSLQETFPAKVAYAFLMKENIENLRESLLSQFNLDYGYCDNSIQLLKLSQDNKLIVGVSNYWIRVHSYKDKNIIRVFKCLDQIVGLEISADNQWVFFITKKEALAWSQATNECFSLISLKGNGLRSLAIQNTCKFLAYGFINGKIALWNFHKVKHKCDLLSHKSAASRLIFIKDNFLVSGGDHFEKDFDPIIRIWNVKKLCLICILEGHGLNIIQLAFDDNNDILISLSKDCTIKVWDIKKAIEESTEKDHGTFKELRVKVFTKADEALEKIANIKNQCIQQKQNNLTDFEAQFKTFLSKFASNPKSNYEKSSFCIPKTKMDNFSQRSVSFIITKTSHNIIIIDSLLKTATLYDYITWKREKKFKTIQHEHASNLCLNSDSNSLIYNYQNEFFYEIDIQTKSCVSTPLFSSLLLHAYSSITRERILISVFFSLPGPIYYFTIWDLRTQKYLGLFKSGSSEITCLDISLNKKYFLVSTADLEIIIWDIESKTIKTVLKNHSGNHKIALSNDGQYCCILDYRTLILTDVNTKKEVCTIYGANELNIYMISQLGCKYFMYFDSGEINMINFNSKDINRCNKKNFAFTSMKKYAVITLIGQDFIFGIIKLRVLPNENTMRIY